MKKLSEARSIANKLEMERASAYKDEFLVWTLALLYSDYILEDLPTAVCVIKSAYRHIYTAG